MFTASVTPQPLGRTRGDTGTDGQGRAEQGQAWKLWLYIPPALAKSRTCWPAAGPEQQGWAAALTCTFMAQPHEGSPAARLAEHTCSRSFCSPTAAGIQSKKQQSKTSLLWTAVQNPLKSTPKSPQQPLPTETSLSRAELPSLHHCHCNSILPELRDLLGIHLRAVCQPERLWGGGTALSCPHTLQDSTACPQQPQPLLLPG